MSGKFFLIAAFYFASAFAAEIFIQSPRVSFNGEWGQYDECPPGMYVIGFQLISESDQGLFGDDSALGGILLYCFSITARMNTPNFLSWFASPKKYVMVSSTLGHAGNVRLPHECSFPEYAVGFELRADYDHGIVYDDTAANNMRLICTDGSVVEGDGEPWGEWTGEQHCPRGFRVCGIRTQVEEEGTSDETTLNNIELGCCQMVVIEIFSNVHGTPFLRPNTNM
ncbi:unnamed protein product [Allacma fusca]|uniref:Vitelline membrane outer layer protein 1 n=1 Tax=Allacma fusca TaxID=39272 RepID=A0A8J2PE24_9HEXA|nr:unnamed protein product [Allacma fusca]